MFNIFDNMMKSYSLSDEYKSLLQRIEDLEEKVKHLEEENIETSNVLYEIMNNIDAVDARIDILTVEKWKNGNV